MSRYNTDRAEREEYGSALGRICCLLLLFCCFETVSKMSQLFLAPTGPLVAMMQLHTTIGIGPQAELFFLIFTQPSPQGCSKKKAKKPFAKMYESGFHAPAQLQHNCKMCTLYCDSCTTQ